MSGIDFSKLSLEELNNVIAEAEKARSLIVEKRRSELLAELEKLNEISRPPASEAKSEPPKQRARRQPRHVYEDEKGNKWHGIGAKPNWIIEFLGKGGDLKSIKRQIR